MLNQFGMCSKKSTCGLHCVIRAKLNHIHLVQESPNDENHSCCESSKKTAELVATRRCRRRHGLECQRACASDPPSVTRAHTKNPQRLKGFPPTHHLRCKTTSSRNHKLHRTFVNVLKRQDFKQETDALHVPETPKLAFPHLLSENRKLQLEHLSSRLFEELFRLKTDPSKFIKKLNPNATRMHM